MSGMNDLLMPKLGLTMTEGLVAEWCVAPGDSVKQGDIIFVVETEKVANEITADDDGVMGEILVPVGETVLVGTIVARWTGPGQRASAETAAAPAAEPKPASLVVSQPQAQATPANPAVRIVATPLARRQAEELGVALQTVQGSGPHGRIKAADVRAAAARKEGTSASLPAKQAAIAPAAERAPASSLVQAMARRMVEAKQNTPHFYLSAEAEVSELLALRTRLNAQQGQVKLTLNHFIVAAVARALEALPQQNRIWDGGDVVQFRTIEVGVAVSTERGLMAPVLHDLGGCSLDEIARRADQLVQRVRDGKASRDDMQGGAITVSNAGMFNVTYMTPIINPPQSAILGVGSIRDVFRPDANGAPVLKREMGLVLAGDHRLHDGTSGLQFLNRVIDFLQDPYLLLRSGKADK
ncbi:dihydrolipoamide acetyltransferase family protein [Noviherbaspirillum sedimenti]|uniref:Dihydrolipoamide acetyltransferase component of pyruvate dehydrogenase complex n=1 Tax=Noviherbaspirillum sedimenti TaxID=2320865 RepID=A0A3A3G258_9BURK|nr:dihydrolipoamide acetyltransferase family protein [Noviherbaspirillum sedimenti]RJG02547.1 2-oxo acid dehydrogenase subunit E2 [Noviherbaspirillum sedimenti]